MTTAPILRIRGLTKRFGGVMAVRDLTFDVCAGELLGLIGPNGSGKSTVMSMIMGLHTPDVGRIEFEGQAIAGLAPHKIARRGISLVFQHSRALDKQTVLQNLLVPFLHKQGQWARWNRDTIARAISIAKEVGLGALLHRLPDSLPYAALRRLEFGRMLALQPKLMLLDEPFAGLAPEETSEFIALIDRFRANGSTVVVVDHNVKALTRTVDRLVVMNSGSLIAEGAPEVITRDARVQKVYFGSSTANPAVAAPASVTTGAHTEILHLDLRDVSYGRIPVLRNVVLRLNESEVSAVIGLNGAGKSTLLNTIAGFVHGSGSILLRGTDISADRADSRARHGVALVSEGRDLFRFMSVEENLRLAGHLLERSVLTQQLDYIFSVFPILGERKRQDAGTLSGGQQQMLAIGRALMQQPKLLLLDEPTLGLAPIVIDEITQAIERLRKASRISILLAEQNVTFATRLANWIHHLEGGAITWSGDVHAFESTKRHDLI